MFDKLQRLNQERLDFLLNMPLYLDEEIVRKLNDMVNFLMKSLLSENIILEQGFHICNVITGECDMEDSYQEIIRLYNMQGNKIFYPLKRSSQEIKDPFRPAELSERTKSNLGAPPKLSAKPRSSHRINLLPNQ
ncbi:unnamed protein product [Rhizophagus irregularis]|nr:unnamed protein product [Rhizophagus irregularis]